MQRAPLSHLRPRRHAAVCKGVARRSRAVRRPQRAAVALCGAPQMADAAAAPPAWTPEALRARLHELHIDTQTVEHPPAPTVEEHTKYVGHLGGGQAKQLFLSRDGQFFLVSCLTDTEVNLKGAGGGAATPLHHRGLRAWAAAETRRATGRSSERAPGLQSLQAAASDGVRRYDQRAARRAGRGDSVRGCEAPGVCAAPWRCAHARRGAQSSTATPACACCWTRASRCAACGSLGKPCARS